MITFIDVFLAYIMGLLVTLEGVLEKFDFSVMNSFLDVLGTVLYFFPWQRVLPIIGIIIFLQVYRIVVSIVKTVWDLLPLA